MSKFAAKICPVLMFLFCTGILQAQDQKYKAIRGTVVDAGTETVIRGVAVIPDSIADTVFSNERGRYKINLPKEYLLKISFRHSLYHPYRLKISRRTHLQWQRIPMVPASVILDTLFYPSFPENRTIQGIVYSDLNKQRIDNAVIMTTSGKRIQYTDEVGFFRVTIPDSLKSLVIQKHGFQDKLFRIPRAAGHDAVEIGMGPTGEDPYKDFWKTERNYLGLMINELVSGSVGIHYERFLRARHSVGIKASYYLWGWMHLSLINYLSPSRFTGIKAAPFYRHYFSRNTRTGYFFEGKASLGYFNLYSIMYVEDSNDDLDLEYSSKDFLAGASLAIGFSFLDRLKLHHNFSVGFQYFPLRIPDMIYEDPGGTYIPEDQFWYVCGAGSYLEVKYILGKKF
jgi:hypothetical protein